METKSTQHWEQSIIGQKTVSLKINHTWLPNGDSYSSYFYTLDGASTHRYSGGYYFNYTNSFAWMAAMIFITAFNGMGFGYFPYVADTP